MTGLTVLLPLAHAGHAHGAGGAEMAAIGVAAMVIPMVVLVFVGRMFWRAAKRDGGSG